MNLRDLLELLMQEKQRGVDLNSPVRVLGFGNLWAVNGSELVVEVENNGGIIYLRTEKSK